VISRAFRLAVAACTATAALLLPLAPAGAEGAPPTPLHAGANNGTADSLVGPHDWSLQVRPGGFALTLTVLPGSQDMVQLRGQPTIRVFCTPKCDRKKVLFVDSPSGVIAIRGTVTQPTKMTVRVIPVDSPLVRVTRNYTLEATGAVAFTGGAGADPVVGTYFAKRAEYGATRFLANGQVITTDGQQGHWVVFDPQLRLYTVTIGSDRMSLKLVTGQGLVDSTGFAMFETAH